MRTKIEFRCKSCEKLLANTDGNAEIVCPRCGGLNILNIETHHITFIPREERDLEASSGCQIEE